MNTPLSPTRRAALAVAAALTAAMVLGACGASSSTSTTPTASNPSAGPSVGPAASGPHNSADVAFATGMLPHHTQAVAMAAMALSASRNAQINSLATAIRDGQDPEITILRGWLQGWAAPSPAGSGHDMSAMPHGPTMPLASHGPTMPLASHGPTMPPASHGPTMAGMMSDQQMQVLSGATGAAFDRLWLTMMTEHHTGAIQMARTELASGQNPEAKKLAGQIIAAQAAELTTMAALAKALA